MARFDTVLLNKALGEIRAEIVRQDPSLLLNEAADGDPDKALTEARNVLRRTCDIVERQYESLGRIIDGKVQEEAREGLKKHFYEIGAQTTGDQLLLALIHGQKCLAA